MQHGLALSRCGEGAPNSRPPWAGALLLAALVVSTFVVRTTPALATQPPQWLHDTGLYAEQASLQVDPKHLAFSPQYPLWTDGAVKRRWISLPPSTAIDGSDPNAWVFPIGTRLWKEFSFAGQRVETRYLERQANGTWLYAAYAWSADGRAAELVTGRGKRGVFPLGNGRSHTIPGTNDCKACHQGGRNEVLGFSALQLLPDRDPGAPHAEPPSPAYVDLDGLIDKGLLVGFPAWVRQKTGIPAAPPTEQAALGYLHGNCGHCHNEQGPLRNLGLFLRQMIGADHPAAVVSAVGQPVRKAAPGQFPEAALRIEPGRADRSALLQRVSSRYPPLQMPPLGTEVVDDAAVALLRRWIAETDPWRAPTPTHSGGH